MAQAQLIGEILLLVRRRWYLLVGIIGLGGLATALFALGQPSVYETSAKVLIEGQQIPDELARSTVNMPTAARLQLIEQRLMARDSVSALIERLGLFSDLLSLSATRKVDLLRASTRIESIATSGGNAWDNDGGVVAFTITVTLEDPEKAALIANELAREAIEQNLEVRFDRARETLDYFEKEEQRIAIALAAAEAELSEFKKANEGALPEDLEPRRNDLIRLQTAEGDLDRQLLDLDLRRAQLQAMLSGAPGSGLAATAGQTELERIEIELATRRQVLAPNHPELRRLQEQLGAVRALVAEGGAAQATVEDGPQRSAPVHQQIDQISNEIIQMRARRETLREERMRLDASLVRNPVVEASLQEIDRRVEQLRERYADVARRHSEARTGAQLETNQQSERFEILEVALVPDDPIGPNRKKIAVFGIGASAGLAMGLILLLDMLRPVIRTSAQMERQLEIRPVVTIPYVAVPGERIRRLALWAAGAALVVAGLWAAAPLIDRHLVPLDPLKSRLEQGMHLGFPTEQPDQG